MTDFSPKNGLPHHETVKKAFKEKDLWRIFEQTNMSFTNKKLTRDELIGDYREKSLSYGCPLPMMKWKHYGQAKNIWPMKDGKTTSQQVRELAGIEDLKRGPKS